MRALARFCALAAVVLSVGAGLPASADTSADISTPGAGGGFDPQHHFVVVTFGNDPYRPAARAGTTGRRYSGDSYGVAQNAHDQARRIAAVYSLRQVASWPIKELRVHCVVYEILDARPVSAVLAALSKDPRITLAQPLQEFHTLTGSTSGEPATAPYNDPLYGLQTNLVSLGISAAHERSRGAGVRVGLIDTGVDSGHPDLKDRIAGTHSFIPTRPSPGAYRHGTAMAGLIAAVANNNVGIVGIAPLARIEVFEACWQLKPNTDAAACNTFTLAQALAAALAAHTPLINLSISGPADPLLSALVQSGLRRGVIFVGSAADEPDSFPTNIDGVIGVGNSEAGSRADGARARDNPTLAAPGTHVLTLQPAGQYDFESGTSVAAAEITGMVALLLSADSHLSGGSIVSLLKATSPATGSQATGGGASIDIGAALARLQAEHGGRLARATH
jgi:subtilisin family serine protease